MRLKTKTCLLTILAVFMIISTAFPTFAGQQQRRPAKKPPVHVDTIAPRTEDVSTIEGVIAAFYDVISGPAGQPRQWSRDRTLYIPELRFIVIEDRKGKPSMQALTHQQYVDSSNDGLVRNGFFEREIHRVTQQFGNLAHVFSTYESRQKADGPVIARGINSIELYFDGTRWWVTAAQWQDETKTQPIPKEFLP